MLDITITITLADTSYIHLGRRIETRVDSLVYTRWLDGPRESAVLF